MLTAADQNHTFGVSQHVYNSLDVYVPALLVIFECLSKYLSVCMST